MSLKLYVLENGEFKELSAVMHSHNLKPVKILTIGNAIQFYQENYSRHKSQRSQKNEKGYFEKLIDFCLANSISNVHEFEKIHIVRLCEALSETVSNATINRHFNTYRNFFKVLVEHEYLFKAPTEAYKHRKIIKPKIHLWTDEDFAKCRLGLDNDDALILDFMKETGCRSIEAVNLRWTDVDFDSGVISFNSGKNAKIRREFPLIQSVGKILHGLKMRGNHVFTHDGTKYTTDSLYKRIKKSILQNCTNKKLDVKGLRHSFATNLVKQNKQPQVIKELMGHADFRTTQNYLHIDINYLKQQIK